jgi:hypothetical protein
MNVMIEAGCSINLEDEGGIVVKGSLIMRGKQSRPIKVASSDSSSNGISVIGPNKSVEISWSTFDNLGALQSTGTWFSGALTFYKTIVKMEDCQISNCRAEDALNIVSSNEVTLKRLSFVNCDLDGLDIDFANAIVQNCSFMEIGGDAIDISGTEISISDVTVNGASDKAFSIGENSNAQMTRVVVKNSTVGIAVKDGSKATINQVFLDHSDYAIAVYSKKNYYHGASLYIDNLIMQNNVANIGIEPGQFVELDGRTLDATDTLNHFSRILYTNIDE